MTAQTPPCPVLSRDPREQPRTCPECGALLPGHTLLCSLLPPNPFDDARWSPDWNANGGDTR